MKKRSNSDKFLDPMPFFILHFSFLINKKVQLALHSKPKLFFYVVLSLLYEKA